jgi:hypothetical protein
MQHNKLKSVFQINIFSMTSMTIMMDTIYIY